MLSWTPQLVPRLNSSPVDPFIRTLNLRNKVTVTSPLRENDVCSTRSFRFSPASPPSHQTNCSELPQCLSQWKRFAPFFPLLKAWLSLSLPALRRFPTFQETAGSRSYFTSHGGPCLHALIRNQVQCTYRWRLTAVNPSNHYARKNGHLSYSRCCALYHLYMQLQWGWSFLFCQIHVLPRLQVV